MILVFSLSFLCFLTNVLRYTGFKKTLMIADALMMCLNIMPDLAFMVVNLPHSQCKQVPGRPQITLYV